METCYFTDLKKMLKKCIKIETLLVIVLFIGIVFILGKEDEADCDCDK